MSAQTKHTPGPWYVENILSGCGPRIVFGPADETGLRDDVPNTQENARLKAAAPELLEALHDLVTATYHMRDDATSTNANRFPDAHAKARAAIAKAVTP